MATKRKSEKKRDALVDLWQSYSEDGAGPFTASQVMEDLKRICSRYGQKTPSPATVGKRLVALGVGVKRERVYTFGMAA